MRRVLMEILLFWRWWCEIMGRPLNGWSVLSLATGITFGLALGVPSCEDREPEVGDYAVVVNTHSKVIYNEEEFCCYPCEEEPDAGTEEK